MNITSGSPAIGGGYPESSIIFKDNNNYNCGVKIDGSGISVLKPKTYLVRYEFMLLDLSLKSEHNLLSIVTDFIKVKETDNVKEMLMIKYSNEIAKFKDERIHVHYKELHRWLMEE